MASSRATRIAVGLLLLCAVSCHGRVGPQQLSGSFSNVTGEQESWVEQISWHPRAYIYHGFLSDAECDAIVDIARPLMRRSTVVGANGKSVTDNIRTSYGTFLRRRHNDLVTEVEDRLAEWVKLPVTFQEDMQILRYAVGQKYGAHYDSLDNDSPRIATVLLYLRATDLEGGETAFPKNSEWIGRPGAADYSACAEGHVAAKPKKGDALLFYSLKPDGKSDPASMHTGCPVVAGTKWTATKWIHTLPFHPEWLQEQHKEIPLMPEDCQDAHTMCRKWAAGGECSKNAEYMVGDGGMGLGSCRAACKACELCKEDDVACRARNRERAGFLALDKAD